MVLYMSTLKVTPEPRIRALPQVTLEDLRTLLVIPLWHASRPSAAAVFRVSRATIYEMARDERVPTVRISANRMVVPVPALLKLLGDDLSPHADGDLDPQVVA